MRETGILVSVVIPTRDRPQLIFNAVRSVLAQTLCSLEVIVVLDGPQPLTAQVLDQIRDSRLRTVTLPKPQGLGNARNQGISKAHGNWIALLDDDDVWLPNKLQRQIDTARQCRSEYPIVATHFISRTNTGDLVWPRRKPRPDEPLSEYMFCQTTPFGGEGVILPSTILTSRDLLLRAPFRTNIRRHEDADWILRIAEIPGTEIVFVSGDEPLAIWHQEETRPRLSVGTEWRESLEWVEEQSSRLTRRAYAGFVLTGISTLAARGRDWRAFFVLPWLAWRRGQPSVTDHLAHLAIWLLPPDIRRRITLSLAQLLPFGNRPD